MSARFDEHGILVVGASLAGLRACAALRKHGYDGRLTVIGDEPHLPYDRPPLSKEFLAGGTDGADLPLPVAGLGITWQLGRRATRLHLAARTVEVDDGTRFPFDGLVIATGSTARPWPAAPAGVHTLRGLDDARSLRAALRRDGRLLVIGAGFVGSEVAATARGAGVDVTVVDPAPQPLHRAVGEAAGEFVAALHRQAGVDLRTSTKVVSLEGVRKLTGARLSDGTEVPATAAVVALGSAPATGWLAGSGLDITAGVRCDRHARVLRRDGTPAPGVVAAGDVTRWPHPWADAPGVTLGHWSHAAEQAETAAHSLLFPGAPASYRPVPSFWSDQYDVKFRSVGLPALADSADVREYDLGARRLDVAYFRQGRLIGALTGNRVARIAAYRAQLAADLEGR
ncbi:NAD(P)/FAD-dependent oxidoreductase [Amycolatopsis viridis]|uniref:NADPH-dependent 2,4-dienoyl-CoA reductase/sulfur reductase-like enzyme n=1 Tax=Amycolatopsis viridis TaxID=185678 RepID=A0ABX0SPC4_9PSEU|nr:FAD/NAD(P)-binding oxidoreductase [Amycolatopsis viridis]NIH78480.1 NADPH-dependent 2,4-dienoyl-CoA reductase/sulfur reductase-like enzyme [Amycolatopsis viridis]